MLAFQLTCRLLEQQYDYATTDIAVPPEFGDFLIQWGDLNIPEEDVYTEADGGKGREREIHITVKYGLLARQLPEALREVARATAPFAVKLLNVSLFKNDAFDVVKIDVDSPPLHDLNRRVSEAVPHEDSYPEYHPHLTLAYVQKGTSEHLEGEDPFKNGIPREFMVSGMNFKAAGDSENPERATEVLLFSRSRPQAPGVRHPVPQEESVWAARLVEQWQRVGLPLAEMNRRLRQGDWGAAVKYWHSRERYPLACQRFIESVERCLARVSEMDAPLQAPDPFAACAFPTDPGRVEQFLRGSWRRRDPRVVL